MTGDAIKIEANLLETMAKMSKEIPREIAGSNEARSIVKIRGLVGRRIRDRSLNNVAFCL